MGLVLDSSVVINAERQAKPVSDLLSALKDAHGDQEILLSAISVVELREPVTQPALSDQADDGQHEWQRGDDQREEYLWRFHLSEKSA